MLVLEHCTLSTSSDSCWAHMQWKLYKQPITSLFAYCVGKVFCISGMSGMVISHMACSCPMTAQLHICTALLLYRPAMLKRFAVRGCRKCWCFCHCRLPLLYHFWWLKSQHLHSTRQCAPSQHSLSYMQSKRVLWSPRYHPTC